MRKTIICLAAALVTAASCKQESMKINHLPPIPDAAYAKGVSAPFCGLLKPDVLLVAGGANFPDNSLLEGGAKRVYRDIWAFQDGSWIHAGLLPDSTAYGATFSLGDRVIFAGGNAEGKATDRVYSLYLKDGKAIVEALPPLPEPMEQCGWTLDGNQLYLVGGVGTRSIYACEAGIFQWKEVAQLPEPLVQPVAFARDGKLFVWGGFNPETLEVSPRGLCLEDGEWKEAPAIPDDGTFVGGTGVTLPDGRLAVVGGVNRAIFAKALHNGPEDRIPYLSQEPSWYQFRSEVHAFDGAKWTLLTADPACALAGPGVAASAQSLFIAGGELKPGVRSPKIFEITLK